MPNKKKGIVILTEGELKKTLSRLAFEIIEKVANLKILSTQQDQRKNEKQLV